MERGFKRGHPTKVMDGVESVERPPSKQGPKSRLVLKQDRRGHMFENFLCRSAKDHFADAAVPIGAHNQHVAA